MDDLWPVPNERVCALMRAVAERVLLVSEHIVDDMFSASQQGTRFRGVVDDPVLAGGDRRMNRANLLHWLTANIHHPGRRVEPLVDPETLRLARDLVRRGMDTDDLGAWRGGQRVVWRAWVDACFAGASDRDDLRELLKVSEYSITTYIDDSIAALAEYVAQERTGLARNANAERQATVQLLLEGAPISRARAESQIGYALTGDHLAAIVWVDSSEDAAGLDQAAELVMRACDVARRLTLVASTSALWLWLPAGEAPSASTVERAVRDVTGVRVALGRPARDLDGFRRSHLDAGAAQRVLTRVGSDRAVVRFEDVQLVAVLTANMTEAEQFVADVLGEFATADRVLRETVLTYVEERFNGSSTAERLYTHRNTIERRLTRADQLLPRPLVENAASVVAALMLVQLRDAR